MSRATGSIQSVDSKIPVSSFTNGISTFLSKGRQGCDSTPAREAYAPSVGLEPTTTVNHQPEAMSTTNLPRLRPLLLHRRVRRRRSVPTPRRLLLVLRP